MEIQHTVIVMIELLLLICLCLLIRSLISLDCLIVLISRWLSGRSVTRSRVLIWTAAVGGRVGMAVIWKANHKFYCQVIIVIYSDEQVLHYHYILL